MVRLNVSAISARIAIHLLIVTIHATTIAARLRRLVVVLRESGSGDEDEGKQQDLFHFCLSVVVVRAQSSDTLCISAD